LIDGNAGKKVACCVLRPVQDQFLPSGSRCERSDPTAERPRCVIEKECCGAATLDAEKGWKIEVCHNEALKKYPYYSAKGAPKVDLDFACLETAKELVASLTAAGLAAHMLF